VAACKDRLEQIVFNYLETASSMRYGSTHAQLRAAAKKICNSGRFPAPVVEAIKALEPRIIGRVA